MIESVIKVYYLLVLKIPCFEDILNIYVYVFSQYKKYRFSLFNK